MKIRFKIDNQEYNSNTDNYFDISITQYFNEIQPNSFNVDKAKANPFRMGDFVGDTNQGSSCNFDELTITPHCNGTHTECIGHILNTRDRITDNLTDILVPAYLISCEITSGSETEEVYLPELTKNDKVITRQTLYKLIGNLDLQDKALIIRTLPNNSNKLTQDYAENENIFFTNAAMHLIYDKKVKHLLIDQSSIDKANDEGMLSNHRIFWNVGLNQKNKQRDIEHNKTITEFIYVDDKIKDGLYLLNLQIAPFGLDASPSRPILFVITDE